MGIMPSASFVQSMANRSAASASASRGVNGSEDFAQLLAWQMSQGTGLLGAADSSAASATDPFAALLPAGLGQSASTGGMEGLLTLRLLEVVECLLAYTPAASSVQAPAGLPATGPISQNYHAGHGGVDVAVPVGTPIHSTMPGKVAYAGWSTEGYGNLVIVENGPYRTYYAHLQSMPVTVGQTVEAGKVIGLSGNTGNSTGPHVHYEVRVDGQTVEPA